MTTSASPLTSAVVARGRAAAATLPVDVVAHARHCLLDWVGVTVAGSRERTTALVRSEVLDDPGRPRATLLGSGERVGLVWAALVNGTAAHALDYDDVAPAMSGHPSAPVLSALLPVAEELGLDGARFMAAFAAGVETECTVGRLIAPGHYGNGWHATGTLGALGAAAACAAALDLDESAWCTALGLAATSAGGLQGVFGTMAKPLHAGQAAARGLTAARLAQRGFTAPPDIFDVRHGFVSAFTATPPADGSALPPPGHYEVRNVLFKFHAACYGAHASIEALRDALGATPQDPACLGDISGHLVDEGGHRRDGVETVELRVPARVAGGCDGPYPADGMQAKFRVRFAAALVLTGRSTGVSAFTTAAVADKELRSAHDLVQVRADSTLTDSFVAEAAVRTTDGGVRRRRVDMSVPTPTAQLAARWDRLVGKFRELVCPVLGEDRADRLVELVEQAERLPSVADLAGAAGAPP